MGTDIATFTEKAGVVNDKVFDEGLLVKIAPERMSQKDFLPTEVVDLFSYCHRRTFQKAIQHFAFPQKAFPTFGSSKQIQPFSQKTSKTYLKSQKLPPKRPKLQGQLHFKIATCMGADCRMFVTKL